MSETPVPEIYPQSQSADKLARLLFWVLHTVLESFRDSWASVTFKLKIISADYADLRQITFQRPITSRVARDLCVAQRVSIGLQRELSPERNLRNLR